MKIQNNDAYASYNHMLRGYDAKSIARGFNAPENNLFVRGAIGLASLKIDNPFPLDSQAAFLFAKMHRCYSIWRSNGIDSRVNRLRMLRAAAELASMQLENPFDYQIEPVLEPSDEHVSLEAQAEAETKKSVAEDVASGTYIPAKAIRHIFGVLPTKKNAEVE